MAASLRDADGLYAGPIVDPHHHLWDVSLGKHAWLTGPLAADQFPADYRSAAKHHNVVATVHVEANWDASDPLGEVRWLDGLDKAGGIAECYVARASLAEDGAAALVEAYAGHPRVVGIREILSWHPDPAKRFTDDRDRMDDAAWRRGLARLSPNGLSFDLLITPLQMEAALRLAADFPDLQIILEHCGSPIDRDAEGMERWRSGLAALARAPNVALKISDPVAYDPDWTLESLRAVVLECIEAFGTDRCAFASDHPVETPHASFDAIYRAFKTIVREFSDDELKAMFEGNARRLYRL